MIITCPNCATRYRVDPASIGPEGRTVRCSKCRHSWTETPPAEPYTNDTAAPAPEPEVAPPPPIVAAAKAADHSALGTRFGGLTVDEPPVRRARESRRDDRMSGLARSLWVLLAVTVATTVAGAVIWRDAIVQTWPAAAPLYERIGLAPPEEIGLGLSNVSWKAETRDGIRVLSVQGDVANTADRSRPVPPIRGILYDKENRVLQRWTFAAPAARLEPGKRVAFRSELANPAPGAARLELRFEEPPAPR